jgi:single-stranded-DNA-specific exonuclease
MIDPAWIADRQRAFAGALATFAAAPPLILCHDDADGLSSGALLARALGRAGQQAEHRLVGRGENAWSEAIAAELAPRSLGGLLLADLGVGARRPRPDRPAIVVDHHVPVGDGGGAVAVSGHGLEPTPTSSLLAYWCARALGEADDLLWLAAIGLIGDLGDKAPFEELAEARRRYGATALREAVSLLNAPRRAARGDARPALALLLKAANPKEIASGAHPEVEALRAARAEVREAFEAGRRVAPELRGDVALIRLDSPCQIHPLVAQAWVGRLKGKIVIAANSGFRPGYVHFAARGGAGADLVAYLRDRAPAGADEAYGQGHARATGGALRPEAWREFLYRLGFPETRGRPRPAATPAGS